MKLRNLLAAAGICVLAAFSTASRADLVFETFQLTSDHCTGGCGASDASPAGDIVVTDLGGGALSFDITLNDSNVFISTGLDLTVGFNLAGNPTITYSGLTSGFLVAPAGGTTQSAGTFHEDGTGDFEYGVIWGGPNGGPPNGDGSQLNFTITAAGLTLASLQTNADGQFFGVDIFSGTTNNTGAVDASSGTVCTPPVCNPQIIPEPATLALLGIALLGMSVPAIRRRRRNT